MTQITSLVTNTDDMYAEDLTTQPEEKQQEQPPEYSIAPTLSFTTQKSGAESSFPNESKRKPPTVTEGN